MFLCRGRYLIQHSFVSSSVAVVVVAVAIFVVENAVDATADVIVAAAGIVVVATAVAFLLLMRILMLLFSVTFICTDRFCFVFSHKIVFKTSNRSSQIFNFTFCCFLATETNAKFTFLLGYLDS